VDSSLVGPPATTVREAEIDGSISIYDPRSQRVAVLNGTASDIWRLADGEHTLADVVNLLARAYSVDAEAIRADVERTLGELRAAGLLARQ
jgi:hypothetical protein